MKIISQKGRLWFMEQLDYPKKLYYSIEDVRKYIFGNGISRTTLLKLIRKNDIPSVRIMSRIFIPQWWFNKQIQQAVEEPNIK